MGKKRHQCEEKQAYWSVNVVQIENFAESEILNYGFVFKAISFVYSIAELTVQVQNLHPISRTNDETNSCEIFRHQLSINIFINHFSYRLPQCTKLSAAVVCSGPTLKIFILAWLYKEFDLMDLCLLIFLNKII